MFPSSKQLLSSSPRSLLQPTLSSRPLRPRGGVGGKRAGVSRSISILPRPRQPGAPGFPPARDLAPPSRRVPAVDPSLACPRPSSPQPHHERDGDRPQKCPRARGPQPGGERGAAGPGVRDPAAATPTGCGVTATAVEAGRADRCSRLLGPARVPATVPPPASAPARPRAHHLSGSFARGRRRTPRPAREEPPAWGGGPKSRWDEIFTGGWAPHRRCRCSRSPARSARARGRCPDSRCSPPFWLEADEPARRGAAGTTGASAKWREREGAGRGRGARAGGAGARGTPGRRRATRLPPPHLQE